jgi:hypothetical protein
MIRYLYVFICTSFIALPSIFAQDKDANQKYEWYIPQAADSRLAWNSHDPWNEWGFLILVGFNIALGYAYEEIDDGMMSGFSLGGNGFSLAYLTNSTFYTVRLEALSNMTWGPKLSIDLLNPDIRLSLMLPTVFAEITNPQDDNDNLFALVIGVDMLNVRAVYEDLIFV